jgi:hypothetical protein
MAAAAAITNTKYVSIQEDEQRSEQMLGPLLMCTPIAPILASARPGE